MNEGNTLDRQIEGARQRLEALARRIAVTPEQSALLAEALEELSSAMEELNVSAEELRQQNEELVATRQAVEGERQRYQDLFDFAPDGYLVTDRNGIIQNANRAACMLLGVSLDFALGKPVVAFVPEAGRRVFRTRLAQLRVGGVERVQDWEVKMQSRGREEHFSAVLTVAIQRGDESHPAGLRWLIRDVTDRQRAEEARRESEARFRRLAENAPDIIYRYELQPRRGFAFVSPAAIHILGYTPQEHYADPDLGLKLVVPDDRHLLESMLEKETVPPTAVVRWRHKNGSVVWTEQRNIPVFDGTGGLVAIEGIARDITERKQAEEERAQLLAREQAAHAQAVAARVEAEARTRQLETIIESVPEGVLVVDRQGNAVAANSAAAALLGFAERSEALRPLAEYGQYVQILYPDGRPLSPLEWGMLRPLRGERVKLAEARLRLRNGQERLVQASAAPVLDERGEVIQAVAVVWDVTEQRRWERQREVLSRVGQALSQEMNLEVVLQGVMAQTLQVLGADVVAVFLVDPERLELVLAGYRHLRPEVVESIRRVPLSTSALTVRAFATGEIQVVEDVSEVTLGGAETLPLTVLEGVRSVVAVPLRVVGRGVGAMTFGTRLPRRFAPEEIETIARVGDLFGMAIDNARLFQESRQRAEELEAERRRREQFTSVVTHELRGPLTVISGYASLLLRGEGMKLGRLQRAPGIIAEQVSRLNRLISDLMDFSSLETGRFILKPTPADLAAVARQIVEEQQAITTRHRLVLEAPPGTIEGNWDRDRVAQALANLVSNAIKYSPEGGEVGVAVRRMDGEAEVTVRDQGIGIARHDVPLLFQPYSRLDRDRTARGIGLGLYITMGIIEAHEGRIWVESEPGQGSTFHFTLPL